MRIDCHQHFWQYSPEEYPWIQPSWPIRRDYAPADLAPLLAQHGIDGSIAVQARQTFEESLWLLRLADQFPFIRGVVGWVDLCSPKVEVQLKQLAAHPRFVGVRHVVQDEPDDQFMSREDFRSGIARLASFGLAYDILVYPRQMAAAIDLVRAFPNQPFVVDHLAKPPVRDKIVSPWREHMKTLAHFPNVMCKVSGLVTESEWATWKRADFGPYLDTVFDAFGPDRLMFGSDWPVALLAADYSGVIGLAHEYLQGDPKTEAKVFGLNAVRFYDL